MRYQKPAVWFSRQSALRYLKTESDSRDTLSLRYPKAESWFSYKHCTRISKAGRSVRAHSLSPQAAKTLVSLMSEGVLSFSIVQEFSGFCKGENLARPALNQAVYSCIMEASLKFLLPSVDESVHGQGSQLRVSSQERTAFIFIKDYSVISLTDRPDLKDRLADWFHRKWSIPKEAYLESMEECLGGKEPVPQWYAVLDGEKVIAGTGIIENDFHDRKDLAPNLCALYVEPEYRGQGIAGRLLDYACKDMKSRGISVLYLITDHTSFYERYGWEYLCMVQGDGEAEMIRMYVHREEI